MFVAPQIVFVYIISAPDDGTGQSLNVGHDHLHMPERPRRLRCSHREKSQSIIEVKLSLCTPLRHMRE
jgi:hypothetical protein